MIVPDRGFARTELFKWLAERNINFIIHIPRNVHVRTERFEGTLRQFRVDKGKCCSLGTTVYKKDEDLVVPQLIAARENQYSRACDPWFLATYLGFPTTTITKLYARRMIY